VDCVNSKVATLIDSLLSSYEKVGGINHLDGANLPSKSAIALITRDLLRLLFPGFFDEHPVHRAKLHTYTADLINAVRVHLEGEIAKSLEYAPTEEAKPRTFKARAQALTLEFLAELPKIRELLQSDAEAAFTGDPAALSKDEVIVSYPCIEAIAIQRMAHELYLRRIALIPRIMTEWAHFRTGIDLHPGAQIGSHFFIDHGTGTVVGETCTIGNHVKMYQGVGLVARSLSGGQQLRGKKRHPTIEDGVTIYAGATIVGGETVIGAGSTVGANVFLLHSVPPNSLVIYDGLSMRVLNKNSREPVQPDYEI
jgi:serine O-acetyltransferase